MNHINFLSRVCYLSVSFIAKLIQLIKWSTCIYYLNICLNVKLIWPTKKSIYKKKRIVIFFFLKEKKRRRIMGEVGGMKDICKYAAQGQKGDGVWLMPPPVVDLKATLIKVHIRQKPHNFFSRYKRPKLLTSLKMEKKPSNWIQIFLFWAIWSFIQHAAVSIAPLCSLNAFRILFNRKWKQKQLFLGFLLLRGGGTLLKQFTVKLLWIVSSTLFFFFFFCRKISRVEYYSSESGTSNGVLIIVWYTIVKTLFNRVLFVELDISTRFIDCSRIEIVLFALNWLRDFVRFIYRWTKKYGEYEDWGLFEGRV